MQPGRRIPATRSGADGYQHADPAGEPPRRVVQREYRRRVKPLGIIDGEEHRSLFGHRFDGREKRRSDRPRFGRGIRFVRPQQHLVNRAKLRFGKACEHPGRQPAEQVGECAVGSNGLSLRRPGGQHTESKPSSPVDGSHAQRRLAYPGRTLHEQGGRLPGSRPQEIDNRLLFVRSANNPRHVQQNRRFCCTCQHNQLQ